MYSESEIILNLEERINTGEQVDFYTFYPNIIHEEHIINHNESH